MKVDENEACLLTVPHNTSIKTLMVLVNTLDNMTVRVASANKEGIYLQNIRRKSTALSLYGQG